jgi:hypothetical protein
VKTSYTPPFHYSYQCSSSLMSAFANVFAYRYIITGVIMPLLVLLIKYIQRKYHSKYREYDETDRETYWHFGILYNFVPTLFKLDIDSRNPEQTLISLQHFQKSIVDSSFATQLCIEIITALAVMLSFGVLFPPLIIIICISLAVNVYTFRLLIGRWGTIIKEASSVIIDRAKLAQMKKHQNKRIGRVNALRYTVSKNDIVLDEGGSGSPIEKYGGDFLNEEEQSSDDKIDDERSSAVRIASISSTMTETTEQVLVIRNQLELLLIYLDRKKLYKFIRVFRHGLGLTLLIASIVWSFTLFDTIADEIGEQNAFGIVGGMCASPIVMFLFVVAWYLKLKQENLSRIVVVESTNRSPAAKLDPAKERQEGPDNQERIDPSRHTVYQNSKGQSFLSNRFTFSNRAVVPPVGGNKGQNNGFYEDDDDMVGMELHSMSSSMGMSMSYDLETAPSFSQLNPIHRVDTQFQAKRK